MHLRLTSKESIFEYHSRLVGLAELEENEEFEVFVVDFVHLLPLAG